MLFLYAIYVGTFIIILIADIIIINTNLTCDMFQNIHITHVERDEITNENQIKQRHTKDGYKKVKRRYRNQKKTNK